MPYLNFESHYDKAPEIEVAGEHSSWGSWESVLGAICARAARAKAHIVAIDATPASTTPCSAL